MALENPETENQLFSIAPAEGQIPQNFLLDEMFEKSSIPDMFCDGTRGFHTRRDIKLTWRKYFNQRLLDVDGRLARNLDYLFATQYIVEMKQI